VLRSKAADAAFVAAPLLIAFGVKAFYSHAGTSELAFVLAPSCWLAAHLGGVDLVAEDGAGFISGAYRMVVGPACAGVNFFIIAFLAVTFSRWRRDAGPRERIAGLAIAGVAAYAATILTNGLRIILAAHLFQVGTVGWLTPERLHRLAGIAIYGVALVALCRGLAPERRSPLIPLGCYLAVAIGVPLLNGAARNPLFVEHALVVTAASALLLAIVHLASRIQRSKWSAALHKIGDLNPAELDPRVGGCWSGIHGARPRDVRAAVARPVRARRRWRWPAS
jgi:exosortase K